MKIYFAVWAPDEATFWQSWIAAEICTAPGEFAPQYAGAVEVTTSWGGVVTKQTGIDGEGNPIMEPVPGWHCNVRIENGLAAMFTEGLEQYNADGSLKSLWNRTNAATVFGLTQQAADPVTGFPAGMRNQYGVRFADPDEFNSPSNVWQ